MYYVLHALHLLSCICYYTHQQFDRAVRSACDMASHCVIETKIVVSNAFKSNCVPETQEVENATFMRISKWDRGLVTFCTGKALQFSGGPRQDVNVGFLEKLQRLRTAAVNAAVAAVLEIDAEDGSKKRKRTRRTRLSDKDLVSPIINVTGPATHDDAGVVHDALAMRILFGIKNHDLWVEATPQNLEYIRHGVLSAMNAAQTGRKWRPKEGDKDDGDGDRSPGDKDGDGDRSPEVQSPREHEVRHDDQDAAEQR